MSHDCLPGWAQLQSPAGLQLLASIGELARTGFSLAEVSQQLRKAAHDPAEIAAALTQHELRAKATSKFGSLAAQMLFTRSGLEQASRWQVAQAHAARFSAAGCTQFIDLGCGLGAESLAALRQGMQVTAIEIDPLVAEFAAHNLGVQQAQQAQHLAGAQAPLPPETYTVHCADAQDVYPRLAARPQRGIFLDPARRTAGHQETTRLHSAAAYSPDLNFAFTAARSGRAGCIKLGPAFKHELIPADASAEWLSSGGTLLETTLWFGAAAHPELRRSAAVFSNGVWQRLGAREQAPDADSGPLGTYVYEPDGAVIRARLIGKLAGMLGAKMIHPEIAYLTGDALQQTPFARAFRVLAELPAREKDLAHALRQRGIGALEIKKRGVAVDPHILRKRLRLHGENAATIIITRNREKHLTLLVERCD